MLSVVGSSPVPQQGSVGAAAEDVEYAYDDYQSDAVSVVVVGLVEGGDVR